MNNYLLSIIPTPYVFAISEVIWKKLFFYSAVVRKQGGAVCADIASPGSYLWSFPAVGGRRGQLVVSSREDLYGRGLCL